MSTRRVCLIDKRKSETTNAGLWLDRYIFNVAKEDKDSRPKLVREVAEIAVDEAYARWFERWQGVLRDYGAVCREAEVSGRMAVGLGEESVLETSVALHHIYGVSYIPGSALKGLAAAFARQHLGEKWQAESEAYKVVFGDTDSAGYVTFFDALPIPTEKPLLHPDVMTVHHRDYYRGDGKPPADWDSPNPVPFLAATGKYLIALSGPTAWVEAVFEILSHALWNVGVGAKTSSGYGRLKLEAKAPVDRQEAQVDQLVEQIQALKPTDVAGRIHAFYEQWRKLDDPVRKRRVAEAIVAKVKEAGREKQSRKKDWYQELLKELR
ncbi:MAG TPA: type III-B CRISPR module RAMP protein Cmr6 [Desulfotomaculum sp.]|nr:type III-B CRISPR module RAMP protein Cmr6 [Desulfotomaculum sp.]